MARKENFPDTMSPQRHHYIALDLPFSNDKPDTAQLKAAYRRALLKYHPDKGKSLGQGQSIDAITEAYRVLLEYTDEPSRASLQEPVQNVPENIENVDLDDMRYDEKASCYYRACRCGREMAYVVTEDQLYRLGSASGVSPSRTLVACHGCSLWLGIDFVLA